MTKTVRRFSAVGPCIPLGIFVRQTERFLIYRDRDGRDRRIGKQYDFAHVEPCCSCRDHAATQYPRGYED